MTSSGEYKYFTLNAKEQWIENNYPTPDNKETIVDIREDGICLRSFKKFRHDNMILLKTYQTTDFALDPCGVLLYSIDLETNRILLIDLNTHNNNYEEIPCSEFLQPISIKVGNKNIYILDENRVYFVAKINYQIRRFFEIGTYPTHMNIDKDENIYVFDSEEKQIYKISSKDMKVSTVLTDKEKERIILELSTSSPINNNRNILTEVIDFELGKKDGKIYLLTNNSLLIINLLDGRFENKINFASLPGFQPSSLATDSNGNIFIGNIGESEFQSSIKIDNTGNISQIAFNGNANKIMLNKAEDTLLIVSNGNKQIDILKLKETFSSTGVYISKPFDSLKPDLQWHRLSLDAAIPANTFIEVFYHASNSTISPPSSEDQWTKSPLNPRDLLLNNSLGRYLWIKIALHTNNEFNSPKVKGISLFYPRQSYLRYLPSIYQENEGSKEFLEKYLSLYETLFLSIEAKIINFSHYLDPRSTPEGFLPWLSSWLSLAYDETWPKNKFRIFIEKSPDIFLKRGTREGLLEMIDIFLDNDDKSHKTMNISEDTKNTDKDLKVMVFEDFQLDCVKDNKEYLKLYCIDPYSFCVLLNPLMVDQKAVTIVKKIIENEKPAHTIGNVKLLEPWFYLGMHTYLNINTCLSEQVFILGRSALSRDTKMGTYEDSGQMDVRSRMGKDIILT